MNAGGSLNTALMPKLRSRRRSKADDGEGWMVSYADLITLLFIFFSLMLSISVVSKAKFELLTDQFNRSSSASLVEMKKTLDTAIQNQQLKSQVTTGLTDEGLQIQFSEEILFPLGEARLNEMGIGILKKFIQILAGIEKKFHIAVEGHTDDRPIHTAIFDSNWSLSAARSVSVLNLFVAQGIDAKKMMVRAYADTRPIPGSETSSAKNRRVTVLVY